MAQLFKEKGLNAHPDKTCYIVFGSKTYKENISKQLETWELSFGEFDVKKKASDKYLGQVLHTDGNKASVAAAIKDREGKIKGAIFEVKTIIDDFQMQVVGGMMSAWELGEKAMIPSLFSGAGTWVGATQEECDSCDRLQDMFCPKVALRAETRMIRTKHRVWHQKLLLLKRIK